jgi:hypothetical protein
MCYNRLCVDMFLLCVIKMGLPLYHNLFIVPQQIFYGFSTNSKPILYTKHAAKYKNDKDTFNKQLNTIIIARQI